MKIALAAGGTGGHVFPAEALAYELVENNHKVILITDKRFNKYSGSLNKVEKFYLNTNNLSGNIIKKFIAFIKLEISIIHALFILYKQKPDLVIGFGGYPSFPTIVAAFILNINIVIHEQNAYAGRVNRLLEFMAKKIALSFANTYGFKNKSKQIMIGNPVRQDIIKAKDNITLNKKDDNGKFNILVIGGSQGARIFSEVIPKAIAKFKNDIKEHLLITQQCHDQDINEVSNIYKENNVKCKLNSFFKNMPELYSNADLIIARAGASTLAEIAVMGKASILVPLPYAMDDHQTYNAKNFVDKQAAIMIKNSDFNQDNLYNILQDLFNDKEQITNMAHNAVGLAKINAAKDLMNMIISL